MELETFDFIEFEEIDSTNLYFKNNQNTPYDIVIAQFQSNGRGQADNKWYSSKSKNALFSMRFQQKIPVSYYFEINKAVSVGVYNALSKLLKAQNIDTKPLKIKWPNDIYYHNKKLGGILIENALIGEFIEKEIVGIGLNILETDFPNALPNPTSLKLLFPDIDWNILEIIKMIFEHIKREMQTLKPPFYSIQKELYTHILYQYGVIQRFQYKDQIANGIIQDVLQNGQLIVQFEDGETKAFNQKEIVFL